MIDAVEYAKPNLVALLEFPAGRQADPSDVSAASKDRHGSAVNNFRVLTAEE